MVGGICGGACGGSPFVGGVEERGGGGNPCAGFAFWAIWPAWRMWKEVNGLGLGFWGRVGKVWRWLSKVGSSGIRTSEPRWQKDWLTHAAYQAGL